ncbi:MAG: ATP-binding protein [Candidatus Odinarchaeota archaeon]
MIEYKIACIGPAAVGKTTLILATANPKAKIETYHPTKAVELTSIEFPELAMKFQAWDFPGQKFYIEYQMDYYRGTTGAILVFDLTRKETLHTLDQWYKPLLEMAGDIPIVLVGNKCDLRDTAMNEYMVTIEEGREAAKKITEYTDREVPYIEVSATSRINVSSIFKELARMLGSPDLAVVIDSVRSQEKSLDQRVALAKSRDFLAELVAERTRNLLEEKSKVESIIDVMPDGVLVLENNGQVYIANKAIKDYYWRAYYEKLPVSRNWLEIPTDNTFIETIKQLFTKGKGETAVIEFKKKIDDESFHLQISSAFPEPSDQHPPYGVIIEVHDITRFVEFDKMRKKVITSISHEFRTPISIIDQSISNYEKYRYRISEEKQKQLLKTITKNAALLRQMVQELLVISEMDESKIKLECVEFKPHAVIQEVLTDLENEWTEKCITIRKNISDDITLYGDPQKIRQVFMNLIDNALKYSRNNTVITISAEDHYKGKYNRDEIDGVLVQISDQGRGIKEKDMLYLFEKFYRIEDAQEIPGTGLGLAICREIVKLHRGNIFVESKIEEGSTFSVFFPRLKVIPEKGPP